ncbi:MAG: DUF3604 domain-containing protein [Pseudomonadota bacterium]
MKTRGTRQPLYVGLATLAYIGACGTAGTDSEPVPPLSAAESDEATCPSFNSDLDVFWGDLHVHTAYSLDAYGFGTLAGPEDAYRFAKGETIETVIGEATLERPLDFVAVTDHAEWLDLLYLCTDPEQLDTLYCNALRAKSNQTTGAEVFRDYVVPTITLAEPEVTPLCEENPELCEQAWDDNWLRVQQAANQQNDPCAFTAFIGYEWTATPSFSHTHRNVIFASDAVSTQAIDYIRYPTLDLLWEKLDEQCRPEDGCQAITIPHNTNMGDGRTFDVETSTDRSIEWRTRFERLIEIHQEKGNSECLPAYADRLSKRDGHGHAPPDTDCGFEPFITRSSQQTKPDDFDEQDWERMRGTYIRSLLSRGVAYVGEHGHTHDNPLKLGIVGSTDTHMAMPGEVDEEAFQGTVFSMGNVETTLSQPQFNPGGITGVWAEENTREAIFAALQRREVYATSGPRIRLRFSASTDGEPLACKPGDRGNVAMGSEFASSSAPPQFAIEVEADRAPLHKVDVIKASWSNGDLKETVIPVWQAEPGSDRSACITWSDPDFDPTAPAVWYTRVMEAKTRRWSSFMCERADNCDDFAGVDRTIQERAWSSPIWHIREVMEAEE